MPAQLLGMPLPVRVLLVDDDHDDYVLTRDLFTEIPGGRFTLDWVPSYEAALDAMCRDTHNLYLVDYRLEARTGLDLLREARSRGSWAPVILLTGKGQRELALEALRIGAADYLEKGELTATLLERTILFVLRQHRYEAELEQKVWERTEALAVANAALREQDRRKDEFLATLAHELRNPLAPIRNALEIMRLTGDDPAAIEQSRAMLERQVSQMVRLIDDLLDVSRITTGKLRVQRQPVLLAEVIDTAVEISRPVLEKAQVQFTLRPPDRSLSLHADPVRLAQVFSNLLNNAAKYTEPGGSVSLYAEQADAHAVVRVRDTGVGIPAEVLPHVFDLFTQVDRTLNRSQGGLGIGLALVRRLVELHGGTVAANSEGTGKGAEFVVHLPLGEAATAEPDPDMS
jgi:signal transduction histidine kinase